MISSRYYFKNIRYFQRNCRLEKIKISFDLEINRRKFLVKTVTATGYTLAVYPLATSAKQTDIEVIEASVIEIPVEKINFILFQNV